MLPERFGDADYVFAANPSRHVEEGSQDQRYSYIRPLMTISPSAIRLGLPVRSTSAPMTTTSWPTSC